MFFCVGFLLERIQNIKKKMQLGEMKYLARMLLDVPLAGTCEAAKPRVIFIFLAADWPHPQDWR